MRALLYTIFAVLAVTSPLALFTMRLLREPYSDVVAWTTWIYVGGFSVLFALIFARDLVLWTLQLVARYRARKQG